MKSFCLQCIALSICLTGSVRAGGENRANQLLTAELAQKILGGPVEPALTNSDADTEMGKTWVSRVSYSAKESGPSGARITVLIRHADNAEQAKQIFESSKNTFKGVDVAGLGDGGYRTQTPAQLDVLKGPNWIIISAGTLRNPDTALQEKVAREIIGKIPNS